MPAILQTAPFGRSGTLPGSRADDTGPHSRLTTTNLSRFQLEPDHVAGSARLCRGVPVEGQGVEQLEAAPGHRGRPGAVQVEGLRGPAVVDLDVEQVGAEGDGHLEGADGFAGLAVQQRVGDGLVDQQPGRLVELGVAQGGGGHDPPGVGDTLNPAGELPGESHAFLPFVTGDDRLPKIVHDQPPCVAGPPCGPRSASVRPGSEEGGTPWPTPRSTSSPRSTAKRSTTRSTRQERNCRNASTSRTPVPRSPGRARRW